MGGTGGFPRNFLHFHFSYGYFRGEPPVPPSLPTFFSIFWFLKQIIIIVIVIIVIKIIIIIIIVIIIIIIIIT